jgi:hypothetical protein
MALPRRSIATAEIAKAALTHDGRAACRNTLAHSPIHGETRFLRDALPDPEKQRLSPATRLLIASHPYRRVSEPLSKDEFVPFFDFLLRHVCANSDDCCAIELIALKLTILNQPLKIASCVSQER